MKVSLNSIRGLNKRYGCADDFKLSDQELIGKIGAQLGAVDEIIELGKRYQGIFIVKVVSCEKYAGADKLSICKVDDNGRAKAVERDENGQVQVVCGAPNCRQGMLTAWLPPGTTVPASFDSEPFVIETRDIRGQKSNGMLASPKELALGDDHDGLLEIDGDHQPGTDFAEAFELKDDIVLDIENKMFTHRPDCFGFLGIARELAGIQGLTFKSPPWYTTNPTFPDIEDEELKLTVKNEVPGLVPRFTAIAMRDVKVGHSPVWLQVELAKTGIKSINNIVDYANFFMLETAQPIHVYDYDKVKALNKANDVTMTIRNPKPGEKIKLLNGKEIEPRPEAMVVATDEKLICLGGAIGGTDTEVDKNTKNIIVEAANWDMSNMRRTAMEHGIFTDAVTRFTKGQSPLQNLAALAKIVDEIRKDAGGKVVSQVADDNHLPESVKSRNFVYPPVKLSAGFINERLGLNLSAEEIKVLLQNVEFEAGLDGNDLTVKAPFWRTDIELREDIVEEVGRLYGYDKLPLDLPRRDLTPVTKNPMMELKARIRQSLSRAGANEVLTYSFVHGELLGKVGQDPARAFQLANALSPDLQYYRPSLMPSLLEKVHPNIKAGYDEFALFEIGKVHGADNGTDEESLPREFEFTALVIAAADKLKKAGAAYYQARKYLTDLVNVPLEFKPVGQDSQKFAVVQPYNTRRSAMVSIKGGSYLGIIGEFKPGVTRILKLPRYAAGFEVDTTALQEVLHVVNYQPLSRFPKVTQDITLQVPAGLAYQEVFDYLGDEIKKARPTSSATRLEPLDIFQKQGDDSRRNLTFRLTIFSYDRTLTDPEVSKLLSSVAASVKNKFGAEQV